MTTTARPHATLTCKGRDLQRLLRSVLVHAAARDTRVDIPALDQIRFEVTGTALHAIATDRFTIGVARADIETTTPTSDFHVQVPAADLAGVLRTLRVADTATLTLCPNGVEVDDQRITYRLAGTDHAFPAWRGLLAAAMRNPIDPGEQVGLDSRHLAKFQTATQGRTEPLILHHHGPRRAVVITCGNWFLGAAMPVRLDHTPNRSLAPWLAALPTPTRTAKAA